MIFSAIILIYKRRIHFHCENSNPFGSFVWSFNASFQLLLSPVISIACTSAVEQIRNQKNYLMEWKFILERMRDKQGKRVFSHLNQETLEDGKLSWRQLNFSVRWCFPGHKSKLFSEAPGKVLRAKWKTFLMSSSLSNKRKSLELLKSSRMIRKLRRSNLIN